MTVHPPSIVVTRPDYERLSNLVDSAGHGPVSTFLADELDRARIVEAGEVEGAVVTMHSRFVFRDDSTGEIRTASLVYPGEEDIDAGRISVLTPIGAALLGLSKSQSINWKTRSGTPRLLTVVEILPQA